MQGILKDKSVLFRTAVRAVPCPQWPYIAKGGTLVQWDSVLQ